ncbi:single-stranded DNA-binding protein [Sphingomonas histidinilytica]|jgi:single-strand DNA-binding protein|uniref:Single-stranded DNA-binding protein n=9 Tax=Sphingomonadaceae TaxID=41297 RepID=A0A086PDJ8_SPHHM|nr:MULTISPECIES: single-stranded DNA-binding protein [Sphingomonadaceae]OAP32543.1 single-stranded DNA-binding protein [Sphingobium sp. 20006FA]API61587.1 single-stranded DNA-binding protein [Tardibacter chloracetimidivorans]ATE67806.1 single-stranded DNA-binding protein [Rhizorhabdus dicambivorans]EKU72507.1 single-strand binding protein [Sphingobium yanoikuyae ATCC 51230]EQB00686.1 single-stranded DNA-binding protein [Sphingobium baderi LL03]
MQNIVILAGNIGMDPESRTTQGGTRITHFTLATSRPRYSEGKVVRDEKGYRVQDTEWHRITAFNGLGKTVQEHCTKGMKLLVRGRIHYSEWTDGDGVERYGTEIIAETIDFLSRAKSKSDEAGDPDPELDDDVPF